MHIKSAHYPMNPIMLTSVTFFPIETQFMNYFYIYILAYLRKSQLLNCLRNMFYFRSIQIKFCETKYFKGVQLFNLGSKKNALHFKNTNVKK